MKITNVQELIAFMCASYNEGCDPGDGVSIEDAREYFGLEFADLSAVNGTGPWVMEYYGPDGDMFNPDWPSLGHPSYEDELPDGPLTIHDELLFLQASAPGQSGDEWMCWVLVKADVVDDGDDVLVKFSASDIVVRFPGNLGEPVVTGSFHPADLAHILKSAAELVERG
jgi:hypothetical protein